MTTRTFKDNGIFAVPAKNNEFAIPEDFDIPNCTIEDVDRSVFNLFEKELPFTYSHKSGSKKVPVIFATGERFAVLRRKKPLRDKSGALILPLISIMRTGISQVPTMGSATNQSAPMTIKRRLSKEDPFYQRLINNQNLKNSDDVQPGPTGNEIPTIQSTDETKLVRSESDLSNNIFEFITLVPPRYYTANYEVTFWTQYTSQMNDMMMSMMSLYQSFSQRTFKLSTEKGYWFVAYVSEEFSPNSNFDEFTDEERLVRHSFNIAVPSYLVGSVVPGGQKLLRKSYSATSFSFGIETVYKEEKKLAPAGIQSGRVEDYTLEELRTVDEPLPGQSIAGKESEADVDSRGPNKSSHRESEGLGGKESKNS